VPHFFTTSEGSGQDSHNRFTSVFIGVHQWFKRRIQVHGSRLKTDHLHWVATRIAEDSLGKSLRVC